MRSAFKKIPIWKIPSAVSRFNLRLQEEEKKVD